MGPDNALNAPQAKTRLWWRVSLALILLVTLVIYASLWQTPPLSWDDDSNIFANPYFRLGMWWGVWTEPYFGLYVPITSTVWAFLLWAGHGEAWPFRILNLCLHLCNVGMVYLILSSLARRWKIYSPVALAVAVGIFALHPLQVQAVAWISGGRDLFAAFFALAATLVYFRWQGTRGYVAATLLFILALFSKPNVVVLPVVVGLAEAILDPRSRQSTIRRMLPWLGLAAVATALTQLGQGAHFENKALWWQRPLLMLDTYKFYVQKTIFPWPLSANYGHTPVKVLADATVWWKSLLALILIGGVWFFAWSRDCRYALALIWFALLLPISGLVPFAYENIGGVADHYNYLPLIVVAALSLLVMQNATGKLHLLLIIPASLIGVFAYLSWERLEVWENNVNFFLDMAKTSPDSYNTALGMSIIMCKDVRDYNQGISWTERALEMHPNDILALANRAFCLSQAGRIKEIVAMESYMTKIDRAALKATQPTSYSSFLASIGSAKLSENQLNDGFQYLCEAYRVFPAEPNHSHNLEAAAAILKKAGIHPFCEYTFLNESSQ